MFDGGLAMSISTLNYVAAQSFGFCNARHRIGKRPVPVSAIPPSPVMLRADESEGFSMASTGCGLSDPTFGEDYAVGILGGVSVDSSLSFAQKLVDLSTKDRESHGVPFVLCSGPALSRELLLHKRSRAPSGKNKGDNYQLEQRLIVENLRNKRAFLEKSGTRCIVMPCQISHIWHNEVSHGCRVPFLNMAECVAAELKEAKMKPLEASSHPRIGVIGTNAILTAGFYQKELEKEGFEVVLPDRATMEHIVLPAVEASNRKDMEGARNLLRIALQVLLVRAVNSIVLASDDLRGLLPQDDPLVRRFIDPINALARSTIKWAQAAKSGA